MQKFAICHPVVGNFACFGAKSRGVLLWRARCIEFGCGVVQRKVACWQNAQLCAKLLSKQAVRATMCVAKYHARRCATHVVHILVGEWCANHQQSRYGKEFSKPECPTCSCNQGVLSMQRNIPLFVRKFARWMLFWHPPFCCKNGVLQKTRRKTK